MDAQQGKAMLCPLCASLMAPRKRSPLTRMSGSLLLYGVLFVFFFLLPLMKLWSALVLALVAAWSLYTMRPGPLQAGLPSGIQPEAGSNAVRKVAGSAFRSRGGPRMSWFQPPEAARAPEL